MADILQEAKPKIAKSQDTIRESYSVRVEVDDTSVGTTPDAFADFTLNINDIAMLPDDVLRTGRCKAPILAIPSTARCGCVEVAVAEIFRTCSQC